MKIALVDFGPMDYTPDTASERPLGGTQSAACYLAIELARRGHHVIHLSHASDSGMVRGVCCYSWRHVQPEMLAQWNLDALVVLSGLEFIEPVRDYLGSQTRLILWTGHAHDQPGVQFLNRASALEVLDGLVMVSQWQADQFRRKFSIPPEKLVILRNAMAPAFQDMFAPQVSITAGKSEPPVLAYTSTPFRGLDLLLQMFPEIRRRVPEVRLEVFSSMKMYQTSDAEDVRQYGDLYDRARHTPGVEYRGAVSQAILAKALRSVTLLAYSNIFPETSCISVMEAMAAGCQIVTSDMAGLPETTAGFASLISMHRPTYEEAFIRRVVERLEHRRSDATEQRLREQVAFANHQYSWSARAGEWEKFVQQLPARRLSVAAS